ncbi:MAG TPA: A24 family peptidase [Candidatus Baltobacteraceae bacterium]|nr:A24 family peptidase [Candidatus Baltobacteraceae bacterium]
MIQNLLFACLALCANCCYAACGLGAAKRYGIELSLCRGSGAAVIVAGTLVESAALVSHAQAFALPLFLIAFGAVVAGAACDAACGYVFDTITLPALALLASAAAVWQTLPSFALGVAACGGTLTVVYLVTRGRGLGLGDVKLACCIGGAAGVVNGMEALFVAFVLGGAYAAFLLATKRGHRGEELRFAPYLAAGMSAVVLRGIFA